MAKDLEEFVGRYFSEEVETFYTIVLKNDTIVVHQRRLDDANLMVGETDTFSGGGFTYTFERDRNGGKGAAVQTGLEHAHGSITVIQDADLEYDPNDIPRLLQPLIARKADFVSASRFKDKSLVPDMPALKRFGNWGVSKIVSWICGQSFADVSCGFRAYTRETMLQLVLTGSYTYTQESFILLAQRNSDRGSAGTHANLNRWSRATIPALQSQPHRKMQGYIELTIARFGSG